MHYVINEGVGFEPVSGLLWLISASDNHVTLPRFASQLLEILIIEGEKALSREILMDIIWHNNGLSASGNNLNNYISIIRRALSSLGLNDLIITIPKYGFSFHAKNIIKVEPSSVVKDEEILETKKTEDALQHTEESLSKGKSNSVSVRVKLVSLFICLLIILIVFYSYLSYFLYIPKSAMGKYKGRYENCDIYAIWNGKHSFYSMDMMTVEIKKLVDEKKINCKVESKLYLYKSAVSNEFAFAPYRIVISQCPDEKISTCSNVHKYIFVKN